MFLVLTLLAPIDISSHNPAGLFVFSSSCYSFCCRLKFYKPEKETDEAVRYNGKRDIDTLTKFIQDQVNEPEPDKQVLLSCMALMLLSCYMSVMLLSCISVILLSCWYVTYYVYICFHVAVTVMCRCLSCCYHTVIPI